MVEHKITSLQGIDKWNPSQIADSQHEPKSISGNVHGREYRRLVVSVQLHHFLAKQVTYLIVQPISNIEPLEKEDKVHGIGDLAASADCLFTRHADINQCP